MNIVERILIALKLKSASAPIQGKEVDFTRESTWGSEAYVRPIEEKIECSIHAKCFDITAYQGDAIVNAANEQLDAGGGVCGAIFKKNDHALLQDACHAYPVLNQDTDQRCPTGDALVTPSFIRSSETPNEISTGSYKWIVHAVGPIWKGGDQNETELLSQAYSNALHKAHQAGAKSIAFPAISTGIYGFPLLHATQIAVDAVRQYTEKYPDHFTEILFTCFNQDILNIYSATLQPTENVDYASFNSFKYKEQNTNIRTNNDFNPF
jgi:O-acetyl-ADP-ribose deacetylase (regulator of RNase III)